MSAAIVAGQVLAFKAVLRLIGKRDKGIKVKRGNAMATTEPTINDAIAQILRTTRYSWHDQSVVKSENTSQLTGNSKRPDILITEPGVSPVVIEKKSCRPSRLKLKR